MADTEEFEQLLKDLLRVDNKSVQRNDSHLTVNLIPAQKILPVKPNGSKELSSLDEIQVLEDELEYERFLQESKEATHDSNTDTTELERHITEELKHLSDKLEKVEQKQLIIEKGYKSRQEEYDRSKKECVRIEDYKAAQHFKNQLELLQKEYQDSLKEVSLSRRQLQEMIRSLNSKLQTCKVKYTPITNLPSANDPKASLTRKPSIGSSTIFAQVETTKKVKAQYQQDSKPYMEAKAGRFSNLKEYINKEGVDVNAIDFNTGNTALHGVVEIANTMSTSFLETVKYLIQKGANPNLKNRRGQTALHFSVDKRLDEITVYLIEVGGDLMLQDNTGKSPYDYAERTPQYQGELKEMIRTIKKEKAEESMTEHINSLNGRTEAVTIFVRGGLRHTIIVYDHDSASQILTTIAKKLNILDLVPHLELVEEVMGKERKLLLNEEVLSAKDKWPNQNPQFCKFTTKLKRGVPEEIQMKFRKVVHGS